MAPDHRLDAAAALGPPVTAVELIEPTAGPERVGSRRRVDARFSGKDGHFVELRTERVEGRRVAYLIERDTFGLGRVMTQPGFTLDIEPAGSGRCRVVSPSSTIRKECSAMS